MLRYILLGLLGLLLLLLFAPVKAEFLWRREVLSLRLRLLWLIPVAILPAKEKEPEQDKPPKAKKAKKKKPPKPQPPKAPPPPKKGPVQKAVEVMAMRYCRSLRLARVISALAFSSFSFRPVIFCRRTSTLQALPSFRSRQMMLICSQTVASP